MNLVTITFKDREALVCGLLEDFDFALNSEKEEIEVYKDHEFIGYYQSIVGTTEEDLFEYISNCLKQLTEA